MRTIKFRAWDKFVNQWVAFNQPPKAVTGKSTSKILNIHGSDDNVIFMQFTGLKDKNGKEIYEGDIVRISNNLIEEVSWMQGKQWTQGKCPFSGFVDHQAIYKKPVEIIGNIYENKDLLTSD